MTCRGQVINGQILLDEPAELPEGADGTHRCGAAGYGNFSVPAERSSMGSRL